jgi:ubiquinone/menaquinone biosynthesis C-methylase UbiE
MDSEVVKKYFESASVLEQYAEAAKNVGLWRSEEKIFTRVFERKASILELGCGAGRIAFGLHELGYKNILATDFSKSMIQHARHLAKLLEYSVPFRVVDATELEFEDNVFDGAIFGFNGLMQIPKKERREQALREIMRVIRPEGWFVFTTHDRDRSQYQDFWLQEEQRWRAGQQPEELDDFGDRFQVTESGTHFIHIPKAQEIEAVLNQVGFRIEATVMLSEIATETQEVTDFIDECRFWVVQKP